MDLVHLFFLFLWKQKYKTSGIASATVNVTNRQGWTWCQKLYVPPATASETLINSPVPAAYFYLQLCFAIKKKIKWLQFSLNISLNQKQTYKTEEVYPANTAAERWAF